MTSLQCRDKSFVCYTNAMDQLRMDEISPIHGPTNVELGRQQVAQYVLETGFPNSTDKIKGQVSNAFTAAVAETGLPIARIVCSPLSSMGHLKNNAIPGSDLDDLNVFYDQPMTTAQMSEFGTRVEDKVDQRLVDLTRLDLAGFGYVSLSSLVAFQDTDWSAFETIPDNLRVTHHRFQQLIHGTRFYEGESPLMDLLRNSTAGKTVKEPVYDTAEDLQVDRGTKFTRAYLHTHFGQMTETEQYAIVRAMMQNSRSFPIDPLDVTVGGADDAILASLVEKGLFERVKGRYEPTWIWGKSASNVVK